MVAVGISLFGLALVVAILIRGWRLNLLAQFPMFYSYIALHFSCALVLWLVYLFFPEYYSIIFWPLELITRMADCCVLLEIINNLFGSHRVILGPARIGAAGLMFIMLVLYVIPPIFGRSTFEIAMHSLGVRLAASQGLILLVLLWVGQFHGIRLHPNLGVLCFGFGILMANRIADYAFAAFVGRSYIYTLRLVDPTVWVIVLGTWLFGLKRIAPSFQADEPDKIEKSMSVEQLRTLNARLWRLFR